MVVMICFMIYKLSLSIVKNNVILFTFCLLPRGGADKNLFQSKTLLIKIFAQNFFVQKFVGQNFSVKSIFCFFIIVCEKISSPIFFGQNSGVCGGNFLMGMTRI